MTVLLVAMLVALPWYAAAQRQNPDYLSYYFLDRHLLGFATGTQPHGDQPWWYYLPLLLGGGLPWIGYLAAGRGRGRGARAAGRARQAKTLALVLADRLVGVVDRGTVEARDVPVAGLSAGRDLGGLGVGGGHRRHARPKARRSFAGTFVFSSLSGPVVLPAAVLVLQGVFGLRYGWPAWAAVLAVAAAAPLPLVPWRVGRVQAALAAAVVCLAAQFMVVIAMVLPPAAEIYSARELAEHFNRLGRLPERLYVAEERIGSLVFYLDPRLRAGLKPDQVQQIRAKHPPLMPGDVVALPDQQRYRTAAWMDFDGNPCETVGRYRLYHIAAPGGGVKRNVSRAELHPK